MRAWLALLMLGLGGCVAVPEAAVVTPEARPILRYEPLGAPDFTVIALHGFNDRKEAFLSFGAAASASRIRVLAYDQAGFGANPDRGGWAGMAQLQADLFAMIAEARQLAPGKPVFVLGESMGAAIAMAALARPEAPLVEGLILAAPAVWAGEQLNPLFRAGLWLTAVVAPELDLAAEGLDIQASDNIPMLVALGRDPLYLPTARAAALYGLVRAMDRAVAKAPALTMPRLVLLGERDEIVPGRAFDAFLARLVPDGCTVVRYADGWHLLLRDLDRETVHRDVFAWMAKRPLPSGRAAPCGRFRTAHRDAAAHR